MDLNIENYNNDELYNLLEINKNNFSQIILKENLLKKINVINSIQDSELDNKSEFINFYINCYFKLLEILEGSNKLLKIDKERKIEDIDYKLEIISKQLEKNVVQQHPHYVIKTPQNNDLNVFNKNIKSGNINPIYRQTLRKFININTRFRDNYANTSSTNFSILLPTTINKTLSMKLSDISIPLSVYTISDKYNNNSFKINNIPIKINSGSYTSSQIVIAINNVIQKNENEKIRSIQLKYDTNSGLMTFINNSSEGENFTLDFFYNNFICNYDNTNTNNNQITLGWILGFKGPWIIKNYKASSKEIKKKECETINNKTYVLTSKELEKESISSKNYKYDGKNSYTGESIFDPLFNSYFLLSIDDFMNNHNNIFVSPFMHQSFADQNIIARISSSCNNSCTIEYPERIYFGPTNINKLNIKLYDEYGRIVDLNYADYSFVLELEVLYEN